MTELPKGWAWSTVGEICEIAPTDPPLSESAPFIPMASVKVGKRYPVSSEPRGRRGGTRARSGDLLFARITPCLENGKVALVPETMERVGGSTEFIVIRPPNGVLPHLLYRWSQHPEVREAAQSRMTGTTGRMRLSASDLAETPFRLPPHAEQERIAAAIEQAFSKLDAGEAGLRIVRRLLKRMRDAVLAAAVTGRLVPQDPTDTPAAKILADLGIESIKATDVTELPAGWVQTKVRDIALVGSGTTPKRGRPDYWEGGTVPWVTSGAVRAGVIREPSELVTDVALRQTALRLWPPGTLLVAMYGEGQTRGRCAELAIETTCNQACAAISLHPVVDGYRRLLRLHLDANYSANRRLAAGGVQPNLSGTIIKEMIVTLPPVDEATRIVIEADRQFSFLDACARAVDTGLARAAATRRSVLKAAFEGRLVPQEPSDEPASVLLQRIRAERAGAPKPPRRSRRTA